MMMSSLIDSPNYRLALKLFSMMILDYENGSFRIFTKSANAEVFTIFKVFFISIY